MKTKLTLTLCNTDNFKSEKVHFPIVTPTRKKYFDSLDLKKGTWHIASSDFHIKEVNYAIMNPKSFLDEINYFAYIYFTLMTDDAKAVFDLLTESGYVKISDSSELLILLNNLDYYYYIDGISTPDQLASIYLDSFNHPKCKNVNKDDLQKIGRAIVKMENGMFYRNSTYIGIYQNANTQYRSHRVKIPEEFKLFDSE